MPEPTFSPNQASPHTAEDDAARGFAASEFFEASADAGEKPILVDGLISGDPDDAIRRAAATAMCDAATHLQKTRKVAEAALVLAMARLQEAGDAAGAREYAALAQEVEGAAVDNLAKVGGAVEAVLRGLSHTPGERRFFDVVSDAELDIEASR